ncbi:MAG TPA: threonine/serine dehydratase [Acidimicrobiia bacterium]|nr:threonine/serine dehydratase [Acidimicrobiia bacterium]
MILEVSRRDIEDAAARIAPHLRRTPLLELGDVIGGGFELILKLEHLQVTGSFKARGAFSLLTGSPIPAVGVVAASGGNFGIAIAHAAAQLGHRATIFVPGSSPPEKIDRVGVHGADVRIVPGYYDDAREESERFAAETGAFQAHAYDQHQVVAGQGTLAREIEQQADIDTVLVAVGGGGLIGGIASWLRDRATVVAVEPDACRSFNAALEAGHPVEVEVSGVAASSLGARSIGEHPWMARQWIDSSVLVSDEDIVEAQSWLWSTARLAVEPAAATPLAALRTGTVTPEPGSRVVAVISGGNVDPGSVA